MPAPTSVWAASSADGSPPVVVATIRRRFWSSRVSKPAWSQGGGCGVEVLGVDGDVDDLPADLAADGVDGVVDDDGAVVEHDRSVGELLDLVEVLAGDEHAGAAFGDLGDEVPQLEAAAWVEAGGGFVEEQERRFADQRGAEVEPAPHPTRVGAHPALGGVGEPERVDQRGAAGATVVIAEPVEAADQLEVLAPCQQLVDRRVLTGEPEVAACLRRLPGHVRSAHGDVAVVGVEEGGDDVDECRLAGAVRTEQTDDLPGADVEVDAAQCLDRAEGAHHVAHLQDRRRRVAWAMLAIVQGLPVS